MSTPTGRHPSGPNIQGINPRTEEFSRIRDSFLPGLRARAEKAAAAIAELERAEREQPGSMAHRRADDEAHTARQGLTLTPAEVITLVDAIERLSHRQET